MEEKIMEMFRRASMMKLVRAFVIGIIFGLVAFIASGDGGISTGLALLLIYLEYKMR